MNTTQNANSIQATPFTVCGAAMSPRPRSNALSKEIQFQGMNTSKTFFCFRGLQSWSCALTILGLAVQASAMREWDPACPSRSDSNEQAPAAVPQAEYFWAQQSHGNAGVDRWKAERRTNLSAGGNASRSFNTATSGHQVAPGITFQDKALALTHGGCALATTTEGNGIILDTNYGYGTTSNLANVPEPGACTLIGFGLLLFSARHKILAPNNKIKPVQSI
jgi:hypothetical protein